MHALRPLLKKIYYSHWPGQAGSFPYFGTRIHFPKNSHLFHRVCEEDVYERETLRTIKAFLRPKTFYFDIGTNIGLTSVPFLRDAPECQIVSFEPSPGVIPFLRKTHAGSPFNSRWRLIEKAVGDSAGTVEFYTSGAADSAFDGLQNTSRRGDKNVVSVPITTVDTEWKQLGSPAVSMIKIDVEGAELRVLLGVKECVAATRPAILLEWTELNLKAHQCPAESLLTWADEAHYNVHVVPSGVLVSNADLLKWQMSRTHDFLLLPKAGTPKG